MARPSNRETRSYAEKAWHGRGQRPDLLRRQSKNVLSHALDAYGPANDKFAFAGSEE